MLATSPTTSDPTSAPNAESPSRKKRKSRGRGLRTTTGCRTCRARHMKCDEGRPICGPCERSGRECVFGSKTQDQALNATSEDASPETSSNTIHTGSDRDVNAASNNASNDSTLLVRSETAQGSVQNDPDKTSQQLWNSPQGFDGFPNITSPRSTISSTAGWGSDVAPLRWFDLLAGDASRNNDEFSMDLLSWRQTVPQPSSSMSQAVDQSGFPKQQLSFGAPSAPLLPPPTPSMLPVQKEPWQAAIQLQDHQIPIFRRFTDGLGLWLDLFDPMKHFSSFVPHLALANEGLMKAILALAARHMSIKPTEGIDLDRNAAVQYYYETLHYLQKAMQYESYTRSLELIATAIIVSMYEMVDGAGKGWERHLKGVFWIQRSRNIGAESLGLEGAGWWAWLRQDVWAAFRERRRVYSFHRPVLRYADMGQYDLASKSVYLLAQAVNYSSKQDAEEGATNLHIRIDRARFISEMLDEWQRNLTVHFRRLPVPATSHDVFEPIWINPSPLATAIQMYNFARILLLVNQPASGFNEFLRREKQLSEAVEKICGIAMTITEEPSSITSTQCLYAAGLYTHDKDPRKRQAIVKLIDDHQMRTGWPVHSLTEELQAEWTNTDAK